MKTAKTMMMLAIGLVLALTAGCASGPKYSGFLGDYANNMQPGPEGGAKMIWLKPGVDFPKYNKIMIDPVTFYFADDSEYKGMDPEFMKEMSDKFHLALVDAMKDRYPIVAEPGPDTVRIRAAITGIKQSRPVLSGISSIVPVGIAISVVKRGSTGSWAGSGSISMEFMALDSSTNNVIAVAEDERSAGFTERFSKWGSAEDAFKFWAGKLRTFMDGLHPGKP